jgi:hypothetical protein
MAVERCARCGTARRGDLQVCVRCETPFARADGDPDIDIQRPAAPSTVQTHGTMAAMLVLGVVILGIVLALSVRNVGPFDAQISTTRPAGTGQVAVTVTVSNHGSRPGRGNCRVEVTGEDGIHSIVAPFTTAKIPGKGSVTQEVAVETDKGQPTAVTCS